MERTERLAYWLLCIVLGGGALYVGVRYLLPLLLPFLIALGATGIIMPAARRLSAVLGLSKRFCAVTLLLLLLLSIALLLGWGVSRLISEAGELLSRLLSEYGSFEGAVEAALARMEGVISSIGLLAEDEGGLRERLYEMLLEILPSMLSALASGISALATGALRTLPAVLFGAAVTVISGFYLCFDREGILRGVGDALPRSVKDRILRWRGGMRRLSLCYLRAYLILLLLTFAVLLVGFVLLRVPYAFLMAFVTALVDLLPVLGIGTVLIPWIAVALLQGRYTLGLGLAILYGAVLLLRQIAEPRLVGKSLGIHPLLTVFATYAGWKLLGVVGMLIAPFVAILIKGATSREGAEENKD